MKLGYTLLYVENVPEAMDFYVKAFGLEKSFLHPEKTYGEMATGETKLGFVAHEVASSHGFEYRKQSKIKEPAGIEIGLVTEDVEGSHKKALSAGAQAACPPEEMAWGQTISYVRDINGFLVEICSPIKE